MTYAYWFRYIMIGDYSSSRLPDVGKSSILRRFIDSPFRSTLPLTTTPEFISQTIIIEDLPIKLEIWDTSGSDDYKAITRNFFKNCAGAFLVYDITR
jgi:small GTP-binding protein